MRGNRPAFGVLAKFTRTRYWLRQWSGASASGHVVAPSRPDVSARDGHDPHPESHRERPDRDRTNASTTAPRPDGSAVTCAQRGHGLRLPDRYARAVLDEGH